MINSGKDWAMEKTAFLGFMAAGKVLKREMQSGRLDSVAKAMDPSLKLMTRIAAGAGISAFVLYQAIGKIKAKRKTEIILRQLRAEDSIIKGAPLEKVLGFYGTIHHMAPRLAVDKNIVKELLQNFIKFDRVDLNSIKTLADTHKSMAGADLKLKDMAIKA